jgi:hypothetical protein
MPLLISVIGVPLVSSLAIKRSDPEHATFAALFLNAFGIVFSFNVFDLILDFVLVWVNPKFVMIQGTVGMAGYNEYGHHVRGFLVGTVGSIVIGSLVAVLALLL